MQRPMTLLVLSLCLTACASNSSRVIVDPQGVDMGLYQQDLAECERLAEQTGTGQKTATGAIAGAVVGGLLGAAVGNSSTAGRGAAVGAVVGGASAAGSSTQDETSVAKNCMRGRGYRILN